MPRLTRWYLRVAMLHLGGALVLGLLLQVVAYWLLDMGVPLAALGTLPDAGPSVALLGRAVETLAAAAFVAHALPRIKAFATGR